jgi:hypothetical protein
MIFAEQKFTGRAGMDKYSGSDRRKNPRLTANFVISYRLKQYRGGYDLTQTKDISKGGILLTTNKSFTPGTHLAMTIRFPFIPQRIEVAGMVVDSKEVVRHLIYETRIQFLDLDDNFLRDLAEFVKTRLK